MEEEEEEIEDKDDGNKDNEHDSDVENHQSDSTVQVVVEGDTGKQTSFVKRQSVSSKVLRSSRNGNKRRFYHNLYTSSPSRRLASSPASASSRKLKKNSGTALKENTTKIIKDSAATSFALTNSAQKNSTASNSGTDNTFPAGDSFDNYGRYVSSELRSLKSRYAQELTKLKIQQVLFEAHFMSREQQQQQQEQQQQDLDKIQFSMAPSNSSQSQVVILSTSLPTTSDGVCTPTE